MWHGYEAETADGRFDRMAAGCFPSLDVLPPECRRLEPAEALDGGDDHDDTLPSLIHGACYFRELTEKHRHVAYQFLRAARAAHRSGDATKAAIYLGHARNAHRNVRKNAALARRYADEARALMSARFRAGNH